MYRCDYNEKIECKQKTCSECGWNPEVAKARLDAIIAKMCGEDEEE